MSESVRAADRARPASQGAPGQPPQPTGASAPRAPRRRRRSDHLLPWERRAIKLATLLAILVGWEIYGRSVDPILLTYPVAIAEAFVDMVVDGTLLEALQESLLVLGIGFALGAVGGIVLGLVAGRNEIFNAAIELPVNALYATPMVALIPVLVLWFGFGVTAKVVVVTLFVIFMVLINTLRGVREVDPDLIEVARSFCSSERRMWVDLVLPSSLPFIMTGLRLGIGRGLIGVIVAEFFTAFAGLGYVIVTNANTFQTNRVFVPIVVLMALGVGLTGLLQWLERRVAPWRASAP